MKYEICSRCIMDTTSDPNLDLDANGVCKYCRKYDAKVKMLPSGKVAEEKLKALIDAIKESGKGKEYDCVLGLSGGVDSSYLALLAKKYELRVLAVHVDAGWNSEIAVANIKKMCQKLNIDLHTVVIDWPTMKEVQRAYMFSDLANLDVPQDNVFIAAVIEAARMNGIKYILDGRNLATEGILSSAWQAMAIDLKHIKSVCKAHARKKIDFRKYPHIGPFTYYVTVPYILGIKTVRLLDYVPYSKKIALQALKEEFDWEYYGGKHMESRFTKFFQEYYLPKKFGYNKTRDHISSLIVAGEITRDEGIKEMCDFKPNEKTLIEERDYVLKKLDIPTKEFEAVMNRPPKKNDAYKMTWWINEARKMYVRHMANEKE